MCQVTRYHKPRTQDGITPELTRLYKHRPLVRMRPCPGTNYAISLCPIQSYQRIGLCLSFVTGQNASLLLILLLYFLSSTYIFMLWNRPVPLLLLQRSSGHSGSWSILLSLTINSVVPLYGVMPSSVLGLWYLVTWHTPYSPICLYFHCCLESTGTTFIATKE